MVTVAEARPADFWSVSFRAVSPTDPALRRETGSFPLCPLLCPLSSILGLPLPPPPDRGSIIDMVTSGLADFIAPVLERSFEEEIRIADNC